MLFHRFVSGGSLFIGDPFLFVFLYKKLYCEMQADEQAKVFTEAFVEKVRILHPGIYGQK